MDQCILQLCKAFEIVLCDVFVKGYIKYLKEEGVDPLYFSNVRGCPIAKFFPFVKQGGGKYKYVNMNNDKILTLGNLGYFVGLNPREYDEDGTGSQALDPLIPPSKKMEKNMAAYCLRKIFKRSAFSDYANMKKADAVEKYMEALVHRTKTLADDFRNKSAHKNTITQSKATECIDIIILREARLADLVSRIKPEYL